jgi:hypothetical protein
MSDPLLTTALVGTARITDEIAAAGTPTDALVAGLGAVDRERALLLRAGARAIYREAGQLPARLDDLVIAPAPEETQPLCTPEAAALIPLLLSQQSEWQAVLLRDLLARLVRAEQRVPPELLPAIFVARPAVETRSRWRRVIGARGRWLAQFNPAWKWATEPPVEAEGVPEDAAMLWQEGAPSQRVEILARVRAANPALAREWIGAAWKQERTEMRDSMIDALATHLSMDDEPLLERALDDKTERVRDAALELLPLLPASAFVQRMIARADKMMEWGNDGWHAFHKAAFTPEWQRDGLMEEPKRKTSTLDWHLKQIICCIPPSHWQRRTGSALPRDLIHAAAQTVHAEAIIDGMAQAAWRNHDIAWAKALWDWYGQMLGGINVTSNGLLLDCLPQAEAEAEVLRIMRDSATAQHDHWRHMLERLPRPWSAAFAQTYLDAMRDYAASMAIDTTQIDGNWSASFEDAALAIPPECFAAAQFDPPFPPEILDAQHWSLRHWQEQWRHFGEIISLRQRIIAAVPDANS